MKWRNGVISVPMAGKAAGRAWLASGVLPGFWRERTPALALEEPGGTRGLGMGTGEDNVRALLLPESRQELCLRQQVKPRAAGGGTRRVCRLSCWAVASAGRLCLEAFASRGEDLVGPGFFECMVCNLLLCQLLKALISTCLRPFVSVSLICALPVAPSVGATVFIREESNSFVALEFYKALSLEILRGEGAEQQRALPGVSYLTGTDLQTVLLWRSACCGGGHTGGGLAAFFLLLAFPCGHLDSEVRVLGLS